MNSKANKFSPERLSGKWSSSTSVHLFSTGLQIWAHPQTVARGKFGLGWS